jgi:hypothetical protein
MRLQVADAGNLQEGLFLDETVPPWITDIVIRRSLPAYLKLAFVLQPQTSALRSLKRCVISVEILEFFLYLK